MLRRHAPWALLVLLALVFGGCGRLRQEEEVLATEEVTRKTAAAETAYVATQVAPAEPSAANEYSTQGGCTLNFSTREHVLHVVIRGLRPGEKLKGTIPQSPPEGLTGEPVFEATAGADGVARAAIAIAKVGEYGWTASARGGPISGSLFVGPGMTRAGVPLCGGPPP